MVEGAEFQQPRQARVPRPVLEPLPRPDFPITINCWHMGCLDAMAMHLPIEAYDLVVTDLPYGTTGPESDFNNKKVDLFQYWRLLSNLLKPNGTVVMTTAMPFTIDVINSNRKWFRYDLIWQKNRSSKWMLSNYRPLCNFEVVLVFSRASVFQMVYNSPGNRSILKFDMDEDRHHPHQKPVPLFEWLVRTYSREGDNVLDTCAGSGTTAIACYNAGRHVTLVENHPPMYNVMMRRVRNHCHGSRIIEDGVIVPDDASVFQ